VGFDHGVIPGAGAADGLAGFLFIGEAGFLGDEFNLGSGGLGGLELLGFEDESAAFVEVYAARRGGAVRVMLGDGAY
jgi:hypothetical protein